MIRFFVRAGKSNTSFSRQQILQNHFESKPPLLYREEQTQTTSSNGLVNGSSNYGIPDFPTIPLIVFDAVRFAGLARRWSDRHLP